MQRRPDWPERLAAYVAEGAQVRFRWGEVDCCLWACGGIEAITGIDPAADLRGAYRDRAGAVDALRAFAGGGLRETVEKLANRYGKPALPGPLYAQRGDLVIAEGPKDWPDGLGLCLGATAVYLTPRGPRHVALEKALAAWRI